MRRGFTLMELIVATAISTLLAVSVVSATRAITSARQRVERQVTRADAGRRALEAIVGELRNVRRDPILYEPVVSGHNSGAEGGRIDLLVTTAQRSRPDGAESDQQEVSFFLGRLPQNPLPVLLCRRDHGLDDDPTGGGIVTIVAEGIVDLRFAFRSPEGQWLDEWSSAETRAPDEVRVTVAALGHQAPDVDLQRLQPYVLSTSLRIETNDPTPRPEPGPANGQQPPGGNPQGQTPPGVQP